MSYYLDEHLLRFITDQVETVDFFRKYMAGFLISKHETSLSVCGSDHVNNGMNDEIADTGDLLCAMYGATESVQMEDFFTDTVYRQSLSSSIPECTERGIVSYLSAVSCALGNVTEEDLSKSMYPGCNNIGFNIDTSSADEKIGFAVEDTTTNVSMYSDTVFQVDGAIRDSSLNRIPFGSDTTFGRRHAKLGSSNIAGATIYYNNQVN